MTRRVAMLACLCVALVAPRTTAMPTQEDTVVVARSGDSTSDKPAPSTEVAGPVQPIKMAEMDVTSNIGLRYAKTIVLTKVRNPATKSQEATFSMLLPDRAFISGFSMTIDNKTYTAYVKEKEEAKKVYDQAVSQGVSAGLVATKARDSNHFIVSVNVESLQLVEFRLTYEELLERRNGLYNHAINLHPGSLVPKLTVTVNIKESNKITDLRVPEMRTGNEIDATEDDPQNSEAVIETCEDDREATVTFTPDLEQQKLLMEIFNKKSKESESGRNNNKQDELALGQFVVQYDVERPANGEIMINDGYFAHFYAPENLPALAKYVIFVLDTSGSMMGRKIEQLRQAMQTILSDLKKEDYFCLIQFASSVKVLDLNDALKEPPKESYYYDFSEKTTLLPPSPATQENVDKAKELARRLVASGGTNIYGALSAALDLVQRGPVWFPAVNSTAKPAGTPATTSENPPASSTDPALPTPVPSTDVRPDANELEPIIIFLTDGQPTVGPSSPQKIIDHVTEKNSGPKRAALFSLAFGSDPDRELLRKLSLRNDGFMRPIYEASDAALQLRDFYRQVSSPLLDDVTFTYPPDQVKELTKHKFRMFYLGSELLVAGELVEGATEVSAVVGGWCGVGDGYGRKRHVVNIRLPVPKKNNEVYPLERLFAYLNVKQLLDARDAYDDSRKNETEKQALAIALKYSFVTPLTSLVVVKPNSTNAVDPQSADQEDRPNYGALFASAQLASAPGSPLQITTQAGPGIPAGLGQPGQPGQPGRPALGPSSMLSAFDVDEADVTQQFLPEDYDLRVEAHGPAVNAADSVNGPSTTPLRTSPLAAYRLDKYPWVRDFLQTSTDSIDFTDKGVKVSLKLSKDDKPPKSSSGDAACDNAVGGANGLCVYISRCAAAQNITSADYTTVYCSVDNSFAAVCCPSTSVDV